MLLPGTEIHIVVFCILLIELAFFLFQIIYLFARPNDKERLHFLLLLGFLVYYNAVSGFLPDTGIPISIEIQNLIAYSGGLLLSFYLPFYIYKTFHLTSLKLYAYGGSAVFLLMPFIMCFVLPYLLTRDLDLSRRLVVIVPFVYALSFIFALSTAIYTGYDYLVNTFSRIEVSAIYITVILWSSLPIIVYFNGSQLLENSIVNTGFLFLIIIAVRKNIYASRREYEILVTSTSVENQSPGYVITEDQFPQKCLEYNLTIREIEIIHYMAKGNTHKEISEVLFISKQTVSKHVSNIYTKTSVSQKTELLAKLVYPAFTG